MRQSSEMVTGDLWGKPDKTQEAILWSPVRFPDVRHNFGTLPTLDTKRILRTWYIVHDIWQEYIANFWDLSLSRGEYLFHILWLLYSSPIHTIILDWMPEMNLSESNTIAFYVSYSKLIFTLLVSWLDWYIFHEYLKKQAFWKKDTLIKVNPNHRDISLNP